MGVLGTFILYSLGVRHQTPVIGKPPSLTTTSTPNSSSPSNSTSSGSSSSSSPVTNATGQYKDGSYKGSVEDAYYGNVQVSATVSGGKITNVTFLEYPNTHSTSVIINQQAMPYLKQEAIKAQSSHVNIISGATFTSQAFIQSLSNALSQAKA